MISLYLFTFKMPMAHIANAFLIFIYSSLLAFCKCPYIQAAFLTRQDKFIYPFFIRNIIVHLFRAQSTSCFSTILLAKSHHLFRFLFPIYVVPKLMYPICTYAKLLVKMNISVLEFICVYITLIRAFTKQVNIFLY